ncbi:aldehyde dehydrogenase (NADP(+)) [Planctomicrobium sp. SH664]|uniref:aldehyde dehydrogenase (NADP(+)) n=1 Tax=Planctomicrobium sp. SH664 TaxID=3448125 RepID=UPI003F5CB179
MAVEPVLLNGEWRHSRGTKTFRPFNPARREALPFEFPVSPWEEVEFALQIAADAFQQVRNWPGERFALFLEAYARQVEARASELIETAHLETALPVSPRLKDAELPRTISQLKQGAAACREGSWGLPTIDTAANIRSILAPIGPVAVFGPNNFPFAFNSIAGGDFVAAVAAGNPVLAKGHTTHPRTTQLFAEAAFAAARETDMPPGFIQLIYRTSHEDGARLVSHPLLGATGYTGGRHAGLTLKEAADRVGKPIYLELSSINPVVILPGAVAERGEALVNELVTSALMGAGQFCTNPASIFMLASPATDSFIEQVASRYDAATPGTLLGEGVEQALRAGIVALQQAGAIRVTEKSGGEKERCAVANTLLRVSGSLFLENPHALQTEAFGNCTLVVVAADESELLQVLRALEGNLTGCIYSHSQGADDALYAKIEPELRQRVGRLLNDKMPTGVAVSPAMNHGGPFPSTGHPGFTAVGIPASLRRFAMLQCYDNVRESRLPPLLKNENPGERAWRLIDGQWTRDSLPTS